MSVEENALIIFTKNPVEGKVKTRLAKEIGDKNALKVYLQLLKHTREITEELEVCENKIFYNEFIPAKDKWNEEHYDKYIQEPGSLGEKMKAAFEKIYEEGYKRIVIVSPDCPDLTGLRIKQAFTLLEKNKFVIGPLTDGGYYLLGMSEFDPEVFTNVNFDNGSAFEQTLSLIKKTGANYRVLNETYDVDYAQEIPLRLRKLVGLEEIIDELEDEDEEGNPEEHSFESELDQLKRDEEE